MNNSDLIIHARDLGKRYRLGQQIHADTLRDRLSGIFRRKQPDGEPSRDRQSTFWALRNIDFDVRRGEVLGIIGANGAGKSTLLKILSRITEPTEGEVSIRGRVGSLLEVGTGFHPELTGRENVYLNGAILGMSRSELRRKFDDIVAFAEIDEFLDMPVKRYSSGMRVRLGFAVAAHLEPEVLIVDEVLAVGDVAFQRKCIGKMGDVAGAGRTVLFVSHNLGSVQSLCSRTIVLDRGNVVCDGGVEEGIQNYLTLMKREQALPLKDRTDRQGTGSIRLVDVRATGPSADLDGVWVAGSPGALHIDLDRELGRGWIQCSFKTSLGQHVFSLSTRRTSEYDDMSESPTSFTCRFDEIQLLPGTYHVDVSVKPREREVGDKVIRAAEIEVAPGVLRGRALNAGWGGGVVALPHTWSSSNRTVRGGT